MGPWCVCVWGGGGSGPHLVRCVYSGPSKVWGGANLSALLSPPLTPVAHSSPQRTAVPSPHPSCHRQNVFKAGVMDCSWTPCGRTLLVASYDGTLVSCTFDAEELGEAREGGAGGGWGCCTSLASSLSTPGSSSPHPGQPLLADRDTAASLHACAPPPCTMRTTPLHHAHHPTH